MTTEITIGNSMAEITSLADAFYKSGMFKDTTSAAQAIVKIVAGKELGLGPVYSMTRINMIQGKLGLAAETMGALIKRSGKYNYSVKEHDETKCVIEFTENNKPIYVSTFTLDDAKKADLIKPGGGWMKYPRAMLFSRAISQGARIVAPDVIGGAYTDEELQAIPPQPDVKFEISKPEPPQKPPKTEAQQAVKPEQVVQTSTAITPDQIKQLEVLRQHHDLKTIITANGWDNVKKMADLTTEQAAILIKSCEEKK